MATRQEIEAQIEAAPDDDAAYLILGDLLQLEGDPRGELIALDAAYLRGHDRAAWAHRRAVLLDQHVELQPRTASTIHYHWHLGFVRRISLGTSVNFAAIFGHPSLRYVTELVFLAPGEDGLPDLLVEACRQTPLLRALALGDPDQQAPYWPRGEDPIDLPRLVSNLSRIEQLFTSVPVEIRDAPRLRWLRICNDGDALVRLSSTNLPALQTLSLRDAVLGEAAPLDRVGWLLDTPPPALVELEVIDADGNELIPALLGSPLLGQLRVLRLWNAGITAGTARLIAGGACRHLELLDLSDPTLDDEATAIVSTASREVRTISPWMREILRRPG